MNNKHRNVLTKEKNLVQIREVKKFENQISIHNLDILIAVLDIIDKRLREATCKHKERFGSVSIILTGDPKRIRDGTPSNFDEFADISIVRLNAVNTPSIARKLNEDQFFGLSNKNNTVCF
ncbi:hypothetical protein BpHYR1_016443 [Brachionus plicatilis]|uniref:Uncharacterized protein n=1 Tax=Brachionus plicatilis TaxID=10195 RepID=A0A3M7PNC4_BRAPC|nr:hypothetical protein BpHYR1_016443 [Brachionus plicatilis]